MKIVSGGQTGVDRAALDVAIELGLPHGGYCPKDRVAEDGRIPDRYQLVETSAVDYAVRTERNVLDSDATLIFSRGEPRGGTYLTVLLARQYDKPFILVDPDDQFAADQIATWLRAHAVQILNIAGPRESQSPGIGAVTEQILRQVFKE